MKKTIGIFFLFLMCAMNAYAKPYYEKNILRVCTDPYMLPFSNLEGEGFENKISELLAKKMGMELEYEFFPQRMGFYRNTLKREKTDGSHPCDLVITAPAGLEMAATTDPYYKTTYVLAYKKGGKLDGLENPNDLKKMVTEKELDIKFGLMNRGPQQLWVFQNDLLQYMVSYQGHTGDIKQHPGQMLMEDLAEDRIDATIIMGAVAAFYAKEYADKGEIVLLPMQDDPKNPEARFNYNFSMAVRYGEKEWKEKVNKTIQENMDEIHQILKDYGVPLIK